MGGGGVRSEDANKVPRQKKSAFYSLITLKPFCVYILGSDGGF